MVFEQGAPYDMLPDQYRYFLNKAKDIGHVSGFGAMAKRDRTQVSPKTEGAGTSGAATEGE